MCQRERIGMETKGRGDTYHTVVTPSADRDRARGNIQAPSRKVSCESHYGTAESTAPSHEVLDVIQ